MLEKSTLLKGPQGYTVKERGSDRLFVNTKNASWFRTNVTGTYILQTLLDGNNTVGEVVRIVAEECFIDEEDIEADIMTFLQDAVDHGMCEDTRAEASTSDEPGRLQMGSTPWPALTEVWIHPHGLCNLQCRYCYNYESELSVKNGFLSIDALKLFLGGIQEEMGAQRNLSVLISGGEPMLLPEQSLKVIKCVRESGISSIISLLSNGTVGSESEWRQLLPLLNAVQFALDGSCPETNDFVRGKGSFDKTVNTIRMIRAIDSEFEIHIRFAVTAYNCSDMVSFMGLANDLQANFLSFCTVYPHGRGRDNTDLIPSNEELWRVMAEVKRAYQVLRVTGRSGLLVSPGNLDPAVRLVKQCRRGTCAAGRSSVLVSENGNVYPCVSLQAPEFVLGNIYRSPARNILAKGRSWADQTNVDTMDGCKECEYRYICGGSCKASNWHTTGDVRGLDRYLVDEATGKCKWHDALEDRMWTFPDYPTQRKRMADHVALTQVAASAGRAGEASAKVQSAGG